MSHPLLNTIRSIPRRQLDWSTKFHDTLERETFVETENLLRDVIDSLRVLMHASRTAGLNTRALVEHYESDDFELSDKARIAFLQGHFAAGERGSRIGAMAAQQMIADANQYADSFLSTIAPWLADAEAGRERD